MIRNGDRLYKEDMCVLKARDEGEGKANQSQRVIADKVQN